MRLDPSPTYLQGFTGEGLKLMQGTGMRREGYVCSLVYAPERTFPWEVPSFGCTAKQAHQPLQYPSLGSRDLAWEAQEQSLQNDPSTSHAWLLVANLG